MDLAVGWRVPGYRNLRELGSGASGRVVMAVDEDGDTLVAVKYLADELVRSERFREEFRGDASRLAGVRSEHVVRVREYVEADDGAAVVMDLVDGVSLRELLAARGPLEPEAALAVFKGSLLGLSAAHGAGVVHRDHRPEKVLVTADGVAVLTGFGIAVRSGVPDDAGGTPAYMPPERWQHGLVLPAGDVYAAAAVFFECLTGRPPYEAASVSALTEQHLQAPVPVEDVPEEVRGLLQRGLAKDPVERTENGTEFATELQAVAEAAYGEDWERRGQRSLAVAVAELAVLELSEAENSLPEGAEASLPEGEEAPGDAPTGEDEPAPAVEDTAPTVIAATVNRRGKARPLSGKNKKILLACSVIGLIACLILLLSDGDPDGEKPSTARPGSSPLLAAEAATVTVPDVVGAAQTDAENGMRAAGLVPYVMFRQSLTQKPGTVIETDPPAGATVGRDALVGLILAQRTPVNAVAVPDVRGSSYSRAEAAIRGVGLTPRRVDQEVPDGQATAAGEVLSTDPGAGTEVEKGSQVTVRVAKAAANTAVPVPNVARMPQDQAARTIRDAGLNPVAVTRQTTDVPRGQVISTDPKAGASVPSGASVTLYVAQAPREQNVLVPGVAGSSYEAAAQALRDAGLVPERVDRENTGVAEGTALGTDPPPRTTVKAGSKVVVYVAQAPPLSLSATASVTPATSSGFVRCDRGYTFAFSGSVSASRGPVTVTYRWVRGDGRTGPVGTLRFAGTGPQTLPVARSVWRVGGRDFTGWAKLEVLTPNAAMSDPAVFVYDCRRRGGR